MKRRFLFCLVALASLFGKCCAQVVVVTRGFPGENTADIDHRTQAELLKASPDLVVVFTGMNDAVNDKKFLDPKSTREHLESIVDLCAAARARVVLVTVHNPDTSRLLRRHRPEAYGRLSPEQRIERTNRAILSVGREHHLPVADFHRLLRMRGGATSEWSTDGVHLTAKGYKLLATAVYQQIRKIRHVRRILCLGDSLTFGVGVRNSAESQSPDTYPEQLKRLIDGAGTE